MSTNPTMYDPDTHPIAAAYVAACRLRRNPLAARGEWLRSDEERKYTFVVDWVWHARATQSRMWRARDAGHWCRPSEVKEKLRAWVDTLGIMPDRYTYWVEARAYPIDPYYGRRVTRRVSYAIDKVFIYAYHPTAGSGTCGQRSTARRWGPGRRTTTSRPRLRRHHNHERSPP